MMSYWRHISVHRLFGADLPNIVGPFLGERFVDLSSAVFGRLLERERLLWTVAIPMDS